MKQYLRVNVSEGMFSQEACASFTIDDKKYTLFLDREDLHGNLMPVEVICAIGIEVLVDLPRETFTSGCRLLIPRSYLISPDSVLLEK